MPKQKNAFQYIKYLCNAGNTLRRFYHPFAQVVTNYEFANEKQQDSFTSVSAETKAVIFVCKQG
jgi:hypothetical protein